MPKESAKTTAEFLGGANSKIAIGPASAIAKWNTEPSGKVRLVFTSWGGVEKQLPKELQPTHGHELTPYLVADSAEHAKKITAAIKAWLLKKHPDLTQVKQKELLRFVSGEKFYWIEANPELESNFAFGAIYQKALIPWSICGDAEQPAILWRGGYRVRVTITDSEVRFEADASTAKRQPPKKHGTLKLDDGVLGAISLDNTFANLRERVPPATLKNPKKPTVLKGKKLEHGDAFIAKIAKGTYTIETGDVAAKLRWLSLKRG